MPDKRIKQKTVTGAVEFIENHTDGPATAKLVLGLRDQRMLDALSRHKQGTIIIVYNSDNVDVGSLVKRLLWADGQTESTLAENAGTSWIFYYPA